MKSDSVFLCPRCSKERMKKRISTNALSRYADVYICDLCGTDEAIRDSVGRQLPLNEWGCVSDEKIFKIIGIVLLIFFFLFILTRVIQFIGHSIDESKDLSENTKYEEVVEDILIVALADNEAIEGRSVGGGSALIFVQSGKVNEELYYRFIIN